ncbi:MAG: hypothetical protein WC782_12705 [Methylococcaceae bacterium]|jgi:hypothetical protein
MSAQTIFPLPVTNRQWSVSFRVLLALYAIIPLCIVVQLCDSWLWHNQLQQNLPSSPTHLILFQLLFGTPHIIASAILMLSNREYLDFYRQKIAWMTLAIALFFAIASIFVPYRVLYVMVAGWTVYHVLRQQQGLARQLCKLPSWAFYCLLWLSVAAGLLVYMGIFLKNSLTPEQAVWVFNTAAGLCLALLLATFYCQRLVASNFGRGFLWSNSLLVLSSFYLYSQQYYFLAILVPRLVHDITAYIFYVTHDLNRHSEKPQNYLYRYAEQWKIPVIVVLPLLSFSLAFVLQRYGDAWVNSFLAFFGFQTGKAISVGLLGYLALMHYYTEAFTWKQGSPYRRYIAFSK